MDTVRIRGASEMEALLKKLPEKLSERAVLGALRESAKPVLEEARSRAPVGKQDKGRARVRLTKGGKTRIDPGTLRDNLKIMTVPRGLSSHSASVVVTVGRAFWGMFVEFGTRYIIPRPFLRPAFEARWRESLDRLGKDLGDQIERAAASMARRWR